MCNDIHYQSVGSLCTRFLNVAMLLSIFNESIRCSIANPTAAAFIVLSIANPPIRIESYCIVFGQGGGYYCTGHPQNAAGQYPT